MWERTGKACRWKHLGAPSVRDMFGGGRATKAVPAPGGYRFAPPGKAGPSRPTINTYLSFCSFPCHALLEDLGGEPNYDGRESRTQT